MIFLWFEIRVKRAAIKTEIKFMKTVYSDLTGLNVLKIIKMWIY